MKRTSFVASAARRFLALGLLPMVIVGVIASTRLADVQRQAVNWRHRLMAETVCAETELFLSEPVVALRQMKGVHDPVAVAQSLRSSAANLEFVESIELVDASSTVVAVGLGPGVQSRERDLIGLDRSRDAQVMAARSAGRPAWSGVFISGISGARCIEVAVPLDDRIAVATLAIESLAASTRRTSLEPDAVTVVLDRTGTVLFHTKPAIVAQRPNWRTLQPIAQALDGKTGSYRYELAGEDTLGSTALVGGAEWIVLVEQDWHDASRPISAVLWWIGIATGIVALVAGAGALLFAREFTSPISRLIRFVEAVGKGDYASDPGSYRHRELNDLAKSFRDMADAVSERQRDLAASREDLERRNVELDGIVRTVVNAMGRIVEARDPYTQGHQEHVAELAKAIADEMGLPEEVTDGIEMAAAVHDIGKLAIPAEILMKPGILTPTEFALVQGHSQQGYEILKGITFPWPVADAVLEHHERLDGSGYPQGLRADEIGLPGRVLAVADVINAMMSHRPYRAALSEDEAIREVVQHPECYDADVTAAVVRLRVSGRLPGPE